VAQFELKAKLKCRTLYFVSKFQALTSRRFRLGFHRFNLHRLTTLDRGPLETVDERRSSVAPF
jgi:hypothetical protein